MILKKNSKKELLFIYFYLIVNIFYIIHCFNISQLEINYFTENNNLYYVNALNNVQGDLYFEVWGEETNTRYFFGINKTTGNNILFNEQQFFQVISTSTSIYHESIIIDYENEDYIFSMNFQNFDFINFFIFKIILYLNKRILILKSEQ